jgi:hypothetical protein
MAAMAMSKEDRARLRERAGTYFVGLAIGCMIVGVLFMTRAMMRRQAEVRAAAGPAVNQPAPARR